LRLFVALELGEAARAELAAWAVRCAPDIPAARPLAPEALHLTLAFLGEQPEEALEPLGAAIAGEEAIPRDLATAGALALPPRRPRVLAVAVEDPSGGLARVRAEVVGGLERARLYRDEPRPFRPHVTVARSRGAGIERSALVALPQPPALALEATGLALLRTHSQRGGARYEALVRRA
jgi:2'-5' RNA ligase